MPLRDARLVTRVYGDNSVSSRNITDLYSDNYQASSGSSGWLITKAGDAYFQTATIKGNITASSGNIAGWSIGTGALTSTAGAGAGIQSTTGSGYHLWLGSTTPASAPFSVTTTGSVKATDFRDATMTDFFKSGDWNGVSTDIPDTGSTAGWAFDAGGTTGVGSLQLNGRIFVREDGEAAAPKLSSPDAQTSGWYPTLTGADPSWVLSITGIDRLQASSDTIATFGNHSDGREWFLNVSTSTATASNPTLGVRYAAGGGNVFGWYASSTNEISMVFGGNEIGGFRSNVVRFQQAYSQTTSASANLVVSTTDGQLKRSTSSRRYKANERNVSIDVTRLDPKSFTGTTGGRTHVGLIAEDVAEVFPEAVLDDAAGQPDAIDWNAIAAGIISTVKNLDGRLKAAGL